MDQYLWKYHIFSGMNIHFNPAMTWCEQKRGTIGFDTLPYMGVRPGYTRYIQIYQNIQVDPGLWGRASLTVTQMLHPHFEAPFRPWQGNPSGRTPEALGRPPAQEKQPRHGDWNRPILQINLGMGQVTYDFDWFFRFGEDEHP